jgi:alkaline phosphatase
MGDDGVVAKWRVVVLDSDCDVIDCGESGQQARWLKAELKRQRDLNQRCSVVLFHHPRFSSGPHGDATFMAPMWKQLADAGVDLVLNGHDHIYERFPAMTAEGVVDVKAGMPSIIVGTGGKSHYPAPLARANSIMRSDNRDGVLVLRLNANGWKGALWATDNTLLDEHTGSCR